MGTIILNFISIIFKDLKPNLNVKYDYCMDSMDTNTYYSIIAISYFFYFFNKSKNTWVQGVQIE